MNYFEKIILLPLEVVFFLVRNIITLLVFVIICSSAYTLAPSPAQKKVDKKIEVIERKISPLKKPIFKLGVKLGVLEAEKSIAEKMLYQQIENFSYIIMTFADWIGSKLDKVVNDIITGVIIASVFYGVYKFNFMPSPLNLLKLMLFPTGS